MSPGLERGRVQLAPREASFDLLRENLEAFAVAIVMALVIKHFCLEAFRIPTSSMAPTLLGENDAGPDRQEDRIVVDKWAYLFKGPERGDVIVFRYPLDLSRNFIKRVAGLPGEWLRIVHGDLWVRKDEHDAWHIATKRRRVREQLWHALYPPPPDRVDSRAPTAFWTTEGRPDGWRIEGLQHFEFEGGAAARLQHAQTLYANEGGARARDIRVRLRVLPKGPGSLTLSWSPEGGWRTALRLVSGGAAGDRSAVSFHRDDQDLKTVPLESTLTAGRPTEVEWEVVDGEVHVHLDGEERLVTPFEPREQEDHGTQALTLSAEGAEWTVEALRIDRDLHYTTDQTPAPRAELMEPQGLRIPDDSYFMLGDNTTSSSDGRAWTAHGVKLKDGREIWWNVSGDSGTAPRTVSGTGRLRVVDVDGIERTWEKADEAGTERERRISFVPRENIVGQAFYVFWPAFPGFPRRLGWIH